MEGGVDPIQEEHGATEQDGVTAKSRAENRGHAGIQPQRVNVHRLERVASGVLGAILIAGGIRRGSALGLATAVAGGGMLYRGISGHCHVYQALGVGTAPERAGRSSDVPRIQRTVTIDRPAAELYRLWQEFATLQQVMAPFATISAGVDGSFRWSMPGLLGRPYTWESRIIENRAAELLRWESTGGSKLMADGTLRFAPALANRGTRVSLALRFDPPAGLLGKALFKALRIVPNTVARIALQRFKSLAETGEIPTTARSPSTRDTAWTNGIRPHGMLNDRVTTGLGWFSLGLGCAELLAPHQLAAWTGLPDRSLLLRALGLREVVSGVGILATRRRRPWLWSRVAGDVMDLVLLGAALKSPESNKARVAAVAAAVAGVTALDAISGCRQAGASDSWAAIYRARAWRN